MGRGIVVISKTPLSSWELPAVIPSVPITIIWRMHARRLQAARQVFCRESFIHAIGPRGKAETEQREMCVCRPGGTEPEGEADEGGDWDRVGEDRE